ncbi:MAG: homoserine kinase [Planctomycetes bacterium]|nr:homoserine kinase [Planctomycetota bacterium]MCW8135180.1 homoserine kinase [Planctomycetota bacterium]
MPASSANLGPGFDCLALALDIRLEATIEWPTDKVKLHDFDDPLDWWRSAVEPNTNYSGTLLDFSIDHVGEPNLLATSFVKAILRAGPEYYLPKELRCKVSSGITIAQGLGSSAAATVAGAAAAELWRKGEADKQLVFKDAIEIEGHPDNAAAATFGGLQAALHYGNEMRASTVKMHESLKVALCVPRETLKENTHATRSWLPEQLKRKEAVTNQRALLTLLWGLRNGEGKAIAAGFEDRLHVPHRKSMIAGYEDIVHSAVEAGAYGATISGAGGSMIAIGAGDMTPVAQAMAEAYKRHGMDATGLTPKIDQKGLVVEKL